MHFLCAEGNQLLRGKFDLSMSGERMQRTEGIPSSQQKAVLCKSQAVKKPLYECECKGFEHLTKFHNKFLVTFSFKCVKTDYLEWQTEGNPYFCVHLYQFSVKFLAFSSVSMVDSWSFSARLITWSGAIIYLVHRATKAEIFPSNLNSRSPWQYKRRAPYNNHCLVMTPTLFSVITLPQGYTFCATSLFKISIFGG